MIYNKKCKTCNEAFETETPRKTYCSDKCKYGTGVCEVCCKEFLKKIKLPGYFVPQFAGIKNMMM
jgi:hypothetical protein